jgi:hypothetical protein
MPKANAPSERLLQQRWGRHEPSAVPLATEEGEPLRILFPGWPNSDAGPDFQGALIQGSDGRILRGDVELHLAPSGWRQHGHHRDPAYGRVVLHVLWQGERQKGQRPPAHAQPPPAAIYAPDLSGRPAPLPIADDIRPCVHHADSWDDDALGAFLDMEGAGRFRKKASAFAASIAAHGTEHAMHIAICEALGYAKNTAPFRLLAERMPVARLRSIAARHSEESRRAATEALLFGAAGLLPSQRGLQADGYAAALESLWQAHALESQPPLPWRAFRVRPENSPSRRIAALAAMLAAHREGGLLSALAGAVSQGVAEGSPSPVARLLTISSNGYWATHTDFGAPCATSPALLGKSRAAEIIVNVVLPFFAAATESRHEAARAEGCLRLYAAHPPLGENHITQRMEALLLPGRARTLITSARRQQGLIGLYKGRCFALACAGCAFVSPPPV